MIMEHVCVLKRAHGKILHTQTITQPHPWKKATSAEGLDKHSTRGAKTSSDREKNSGGKTSFQQLGHLLCSWNYVV